jgi:uncharacterized protein
MTQRLRKAALAVVWTIALFHVRPAVAQTVDDSFRADIQKLQEVTGAAQNASQMANLVSNQLFQVIKQTQPDIPDRAFEIAKQILDAEFTKVLSGPDGIMNEVASVYAKHFTHDDINSMLAFYATPLGIKMIQTMPAVLQDSAAIGQRLMQQELPRLISLLESRFRAEGLIK